MAEYITQRKTNRISKYGLVRRTEAVLGHVLNTQLPQECTILDLGTADGLMLRNLMERISVNRCLGIGIDLQFSRLKYARENISFIIQADGRILPLNAQSVDLLILTAVLKHVVNLKSLLLECFRVLRPGGLVIATDPTPLGIQFGIFLRHFKRTEIIQSLSLKETRNIFRDCGFNIVQSERFMISPFPFLGSNFIENVLKRSNFDQLFLNQVISAERPKGKSIFELKYFV